MISQENRMQDLLLEKLGTEYEIMDSVVGGAKISIQIAKDGKFMRYDTLEYIFRSKRREDQYLADLSAKIVKDMSGSCGGNIIIFDKSPSSNECAVRNHCGPGEDVCENYDPYSPTGKTSDVAF